MESFVPATENIPGVYQRTLLAQTNALAAIPNRVLILGYRLAAKPSSYDGQVVRVASRGDVQAIAGAGSQLDLLFLAALQSGKLAIFDQTPGGPPILYVMPLPPPAEVGDAEATFTITISGTPTADGQLLAEVGDRQFAVRTLTTDTPTTVASRLNDALALAAPNMMFTAAAVAGVVTLTCRHNGTIGNDLVVHTDVRQAPGITAVAAAGVAGVGDIDLSAHLTATLQDDWAAVVVNQHDATTRALLKPHVELAWNYTYGHSTVLVAPMNGNVSAAQTAAAAVDNFKVLLAHGERNTGAYEPWDAATSARSLPAELAAAAAGRLWSQERPNYNFNRSRLVAYGRPKNIDRSVLNATLGAGVSEIVTTDTASGVLVNPVNTSVTDQTPAKTGAPDQTWQPIEIPKTVAYIRRQAGFALDRFAQSDATEDTQISVEAACLRILRAAQDAGFVKNVTRGSVTSSYQIVGGNTHLVVTLDYSVITGIDIIAVTHSVTRAI